MLHVHLIITAILLLLGAFIGLILCFCVDVIPIIKSRGSTLVSRDTVTREQARALKKSLQKNVAYLNTKSDATAEQRKATSSSNVYESELKKTKSPNGGSSTKQNGIGFSSQTVSVIVETAPSAITSNSGSAFAKSNHRQQQYTCCQEHSSKNLPISSSNTAAPTQYHVWNKDDEGSKQPLLDTSNCQQQLQTTTFNNEAGNHNQNHHHQHQMNNEHPRSNINQTSSADTTDLSHNRQHYPPVAVPTAVCPKRCSCGALMTPPPVLVACTNNRGGTAPRGPPSGSGSNRAWASWKHQQRRLHVHKKSTRASRNSSPYSSASSSTSSSSSGSGRRTRVTRLEDIQEDEDQGAKEEEVELVSVTVEKTPCTLVEADVICIANDDRELLQYVDTKNSITAGSDT